MRRMVFLSLLSVVPCLAAGVILAQDAPRLRGPEPFTRETSAPPMQRQVTDDVRVRRNYPDQPPVIPHSIEGYAMDLNANKCMSCHARKFTDQSQAPMISVTHYQDRDGNTLGGLSPRRYVCVSCHVPQTTARPLVENVFTDMDAIAEPERQPERRTALMAAGISRAWGWFRGNAWVRTAVSPPLYLSLAFLTLGGFVAGVGFWGAFNTALEATNTEQFCTSCHEMKTNVFEELKGTIHFTNRSGVRATCPDCHVPHEWTNKIARKMQASKEVWGHIFGSIDTRDKFLAMRKQLAEREWERMKANDSLECRNCHSSESMDLTKQNPRAASAHERFLFSGERTCIDCHKGIAHRLPDMSGVPGWQ